MILTNFYFHCYFYFLCSSKEIPKNVLLSIPCLPVGIYIILCRFRLYPGQEDNCQGRLLALCSACSVSTSVHVSPLWRWPWSGPWKSRTRALYPHPPPPQWRMWSQRRPVYSGNRTLRSLSSRPRSCQDKMEKEIYVFAPLQWRIIFTVRCPPVNSK